MASCRLPFLLTNGEMNHTSSIAATPHPSSFPEDSSAAPQAGQEEDPSTLCQSHSKDHRELPSPKRAGVLYSSLKQHIDPILASKKQLTKGKDKSPYRGWVRASALKKKGRTISVITTKCLFWMTLNPVTDTGLVSMSTCHWKQSHKQTNQQTPKKPCYFL